MSFVEPLVEREGLSFNKHTSTMLPVDVFACTELLSSACQISINLSSKPVHELNVSQQQLFSAGRLSGTLEAPIQEWMPSSQVERVDLIGCKTQSSAGKALSQCIVM